MTSSGSTEAGRPPGYLQAARFATAAAAQQVYRTIEQALAQARCDLSVYNLLIDGVPHVVVLGAPPPAALDTRLRDLLAAGMAAAVTDDVVRVLAERRREQQQHGTWVEGHYRPGKRLR